MTAARRDVLVATALAAVLLVLAATSRFEDTAVTPFLTGWALVWSAAVLLCCGGLLVARDTASLSRRFGRIAVVLALVMAGQYAAGIGWDFAGEYSAHIAHKAASAALLAGKLYYPYALTYGVDNDYQVYNGSVFTNWGYGVPLLQFPFHALATLVGGGQGPVFFPDRIIFLIYYIASTVLVVRALDAYARERGYRDGAGRLVVIAVLAATLYATTMYWLISYRFIVYEETVAYFVLFEINAVASILLYKATGKARYIYLLGACAGIATLVRPTGMLYLPIFALALWNGKRQNLVRFGVAAAPFFLAFLILNYYKTGHFLGLGINNTNPGIQAAYPDLRFGSSCPSAAGRADIVVSLFSNIFLAPKPNTPALDACIFMLESSPNVVAPFIPYGFSLLFLFYVAFVLRRSVRASTAAPVVGLALLFGSYVYAGAGFAYRYAGDFLPLYALMSAELLLFLKKPLDRRVVLACCALGSVVSLMYLTTIVTPQLRTIAKAKTPADRANWGSYASSVIVNRWNDNNAENLPARRTCADPPDGLPSDKLGWSSDCSLAPFVNVFMALPTAARTQTRHHLVFDLRGWPMPDKVYINGSYYHPQRDSVERAVVFPADVSRMRSPNILISFMWTHPPVDRAGKLASLVIK